MSETGKASMPQNDWHDFFNTECRKPYFSELNVKVGRAYKSSVVYPSIDRVFSAFELTPMEKIKVVILGQDPYHEPHQAHGLCFSVLPEQTKLPPSLQNIYKELHDDIGMEIPKTGFLEPWASQGVLLLNSTLTVREHAANSHSTYGWETFTDAVIREVNEIDRAIVFLLWGSHAIAKKALLNNARHLVLTAPHPSPLSAHRGFFGCRHFSKCNAFLEENGVESIDWRL